MAGSERRAVTTDAIVLVERWLLISAAAFAGVAVIVLNRRLARRLRAEFDAFDILGRYGLGVLLLCFAAGTAMTAFDVAPQYRLPLTVVAAIAVSIGLARDLWWPKGGR